MIPGGILKRSVQFDSLLKSIYRRFPVNGYTKIINDKTNAEKTGEK